MLRCGAGQSEGREGPWEHQETLLSRGPACSNRNMPVVKLGKSVSTEKAKTGLRHKLRLFRVIGPRTGMSKV